MKCLSCATEVPKESRFCLGCGALIHAEVGEAASQQMTAAEPATPAAGSARISVPAQARFVPGMVLAERYRIVAQVGRGGMGEVYRADDLRLGQTVALKFLPVLRGKNPDDLAQLHREVRIARQISHPNVCRVFDIGDSDGVPFITMEFIDGEDLATLMKRIGRLQPDKAIQLAQQLCAGMAEAHSFGVLHRDLKPANIMLDGRGNARITDFGLAIMAGEVRGEDAWAGTPAYMSPEQLSGEKPSVQSDIYALALVLYELFTGREAYGGANIREILQQRQKGAPARISGIVKGLDPSIERTILNCLEKDPRSRPKTVLQIAAALPGGDPLGAVIAGGETPSPEMVAAATDRPPLAVGKLWIMVATILCGIVALVFEVRDGTLLGLLPLENNPSVMTSTARRLVADFGYPAPPADSAGWYDVDRHYMKDLAAHAKPSDPYRQVWSARPGPWRFIYRQSPRPLVTLNPIAPVGLEDPPNDKPGMIRIILDMNGRPRYFSAVPEEIQEGPTARIPDWLPLLSAAGLKDIASAAPRVAPPGLYDSVSAWDGRMSNNSAHIVAAAYKGFPTYFEVLDGPMPETRTTTSASLQKRSMAWLSAIFSIISLVICFLLARRNMRLGRVDHKGAVRVAAFILACNVVSRGLMTHYTGAAQVPNTLKYGVGVAMFNAIALVYLSYVALEPYVRRRWPAMLVSWSRVLLGRFQDTRVGTDLIAGSAIGVVAAVLIRLPHALAVWLNLPQQMPVFPSGVSGLGNSGTMALQGLDGVLANVIIVLVSVVVNTLVLAAMLLIARLLLRRDWIAFLVLGLYLFAVNYNALSQQFVIPALSITYAALAASFLLFVLVRLGIFTFAVTQFTAALCGVGVLTLDPSRWYVWSSVVALTVVAVFVVLGFRAALAGRPLFGRALLED